jgi:hypothetical protein
MTVFAVNMTHDDTTPALQYGDIRFINVRYIYGDEIDNERMPGANTEMLKQAADEFNPAHDYVLLVGDWLQLAHFLKLLGARHTNVHVLRWDKKAEGYLPVWV